MTKTMKTTIMAAASILALSAAAQAGVGSEVRGKVKDTEKKKTEVVQGLGSTAVLNGQMNFGDVYSNLRVGFGTATNIEGTAAAIANSASVTTDTDLLMRNFQGNGGDVAAELDAGIGKANQAGLTAAAIGNSMSATVEKATADTGTQQINGGDIYAGLDAGYGELNGKLEATAAAIGNSASITLDGRNLDSITGSMQLNGGDITAETDLGGKTAKAVEATSAAIGNSLSVTSKVAD